MWDAALENKCYGYKYEIIRFLQNINGKFVSAWVWLPLNIYNLDPVWLTKPNFETHRLECGLQSFHATGQSSSFWHCSNYTAEATQPLTVKLAYFSHRPNDTCTAMLPASTNTRESLKKGGKQKPRKLSRKFRPTLHQCLEDMCRMATSWILIKTILVKHKRLVMLLVLLLKEERDQRFTLYLNYGVKNEGTKLFNDADWCAFIFSLFLLSFVLGAGSLSLQSVT